MRITVHLLDSTLIIQFINHHNLCPCKYSTHIATGYLQWEGVIQSKRSTVKSGVKWQYTLWLLQVLIFQPSTVVLFPSIEWWSAAGVISCCLRAHLWKFMGLSTSFFLLIHTCIHYSYIFYLSTPCHKYHILCCFCHLLTYNCCMWLSQTQREESLINARLLLTSACLKYDDYDLFSSAADFQWPTAKDSCLSAQHDSSWWLTLAPCTLLQTGYECACKWKEKMHFNAKLKWHTH